MNKLLLLTLFIFTTGCSLTPKDASQGPESVAPTNVESLSKDNVEIPQTPTNKDKTEPLVNIEKPEPVIVQPSETCQAAIVESRKNVIGEVEFMGLVREKTGYDARIDSGATTSSLGVFNIIEFERDGKKWVKFTLDQVIDENEAKTRTAPETPEITVYEYPISRISQVKNHATKTSVRRPVIKMLMSLGDKDYKTEVSLTDRSHMTYKILIGREFLRDRFIVDVSQQHMMQGK